MRPKDEIQSVHFSRKQFILYCAIVEPEKYQCHYHVSNDAKHDPFLVDYVKYDKELRSLDTECDNVISLNKNRHLFRFCQRVGEEF